MTPTALRRTSAAPALLVAAAVAAGSLGLIAPPSLAAGAGAAAGHRITAADLAAALPTGEQVRPIGSSLWYRGTVSVVTGLQKGFPADPQVASGYLSTVAVGPLTASLSGFASAADARARARAAAEGAAGSAAALTSVADVGDGGWLYVDKSASGTACTIRWSSGALIGRMTLRVGPADSAVAGKRCTVAGMGPLLDAARATARQMLDVAAGRLRATAVPVALAALVPPTPNGARLLGTVVQPSDAWAVDIAQFDATDLSGSYGRVPFRRAQRILGEAGAKQLATTHFAVGDAALVATVGIFGSPEGAKGWVHEILGDNPSDETPQHVSYPGSSLGYEVKWGKGTGKNMKVTDHQLRVAAGKQAIDLHCARPFDTDPLGTQCSAALQATARAWVAIAAKR